MKTVVDAVNDLRAVAPTDASEVPEGEVELILAYRHHSATSKTHYSDGCTGFNNHIYKKVCTRDEFNQCVAEMSEAKWIPESKPVFTQAMADASELPPVGSSFRVHKTEYFMVGVSSSGSVVGEHPDFAEYKGFHAKDCKPIKSEREKAIYAMKDDIREFKGQYVHLDNYDAGKLYDANYRKLTPSQAKAYDDKTEYFGEDYK